MCVCVYVWDVQVSQMPFFRFLSGDMCRSDVCVSETVSVVLFFFFASAEELLD